MSVQQTFSGRALRARRKQAGLSRDILAFGVGRTVGSIANYERGLTTPSAEIVARLAHIIRCEPGDLFVRETEYV